MDVVFFEAPERLREWLEQHHASERELWVGYAKKGSGIPSITWPESVDEALCYGWIDGIRKSIDERRYCIRFTPRKPRSNWSAINLARVEVLTREGRMRPAGLQVYSERVAGSEANYSHEQRHDIALDPADLQRFQDHAEAWAFFQAQPPGYRRIATHWVVSAKQPATRERRLATLIEDSANQRRIAAARPGKGDA
jgi:uncharacterized protein YdeI (YjbR/CyaY-like superfamily)